MAGRTLVEGLLVFNRIALHDTLTIQHGLPSSWNYASLQVPMFYFDFKRTGKHNYLIKQFSERKTGIKISCHHPKMI